MGDRMKVPARRPSGQGVRRRREVPQWAPAPGGSAAGGGLRRRAAGTRGRRGCGGCRPRPAVRPSLAKTAVTCFWTPRWLSSSRSPIALFERPSATSASTSRSRGAERRQRPVVAGARQQPGTTSGSSAEPPAATRRSEPANSSMSPTRSLRRYPSRSGALREQLRRGPGLDVLGEDHDPDLRGGARGSRAPRAALRR